MLCNVKLHLNIHRQATDSIFFGGGRGINLTFKILLIPILDLRISTSMSGAGGKGLSVNNKNS